MRSVSLAALLLLLPGATADAAAIASHRAIYDLKLIRAGEKSTISSVDGRLAFELQGSACEGWTVNFREVNEFQPADGSSRIDDTQSTAFESSDGLEMQFSQKEFIDSKKQSDSRIKVSRPSKDAEGQAEIMGDEAKPFTVPAGAFLPIQHQSKLMDKARAGETRDVSLVYDGSYGAATYRAITFIGPRKDAGANARDKANSEAAPLLAMPSWPLSISFYPTTGADQDTPAYQVSFDLYENGVVTGLVLDYGDYVLGGELKKLDLLKTAPCP